jgi:chaperonin GroES
MNKSGIYPSGNRILIKPDALEEKTEGGIIIPPKERERHQQAQTAGILIAVGPDAWSHMTKKTYRVIDGELRLVEMETSGYSDPFAEEGDRVTFARYGGLQVRGEDGEMYRILNDEDITARVSDEVEFSDFESRTSLGKVRSPGNG